MRKWLLATAGVLTIIIVGTATIVSMLPEPKSLSRLDSPVEATTYQLPDMRAMMEDKLRRELSPNHLECDSIVRLEIELIDCTALNEGIFTFVLTQFDLRKYDRILAGEYVHAQRNLVISYALTGPQYRTMTTCVNDDQCVTDHNVSAEEAALIAAVAKQTWRGEIELWR